MANKIVINIFDCLNEKEKINYIEELIDNHNIEDAIKILLNKETVPLRFIPYIKKILKKKKISNEKIIETIFNNLLYLNKFDVALEFNKTLTKNERKIILLSKYDKNKKYKVKRDNKFINLIPTVGLATILVLEATNIISTTHSAVTVKVKKDKSTVPNTYLEKNNVKEISDIQLNQTIDNISNELLAKQIKILCNNNEYIYTLGDIGFSLNKENIFNSIKGNDIEINYNLKNTILSNNELMENNVSYNEDSINNVVNDMYNKTKKNSINGVITKLDGQIIKQTNPINGVELNKDELKEKLKSIKFLDKEIKIELGMNEIKATMSTKNIYSSTIGTLSSATTYYNESQTKKKNIKIAVSKINGKVILPGEVFSFRQAAGPYNGSNGYVFYAKDMGSGVCQVSTTLYNAQLKAGLETVSRSNHYEPVSYVSKGLDATVYGSSIDYQFRNNTDYPITIVASAQNGVLTIGISGDQNILGGKSYVPRSVYITNRQYDAYLDVYQNGSIIETRYLGRSYYKY